MIEKITTWAKTNAVALVILAVMLVGGQSASFGAAGDINTQSVWFVKGLTAGNPKVSVIDSSGNVVAPVTSTNGTYSGTISVTGVSTLGVANVGTFTQAGGCSSVATTSTSYTLASTDFDVENCIVVTPGGASLTLTLPASSTLATFVPTVSQTRTVYLRNATTTAGVDITVAGGTGTTLYSASSTKVIMSATTGETYGKIDFIRESDTDINALLTLYK